MAGNRVRGAALTQTKELLSREMRRSKLELFIQQFEKEGARRRRASSQSRASLHLRQ